MPAPATHRSASLVRPIFAGGVLAGMGDLAFALVYHGILSERSSQNVLQTVASGLMGRHAFDAGWGAAVLGLFLHFTIALGAATAFWVLHHFLPVLGRRYWLSGPVYGVIVYLTMNRVVLPLSAFPFPVGFSMAELIGHAFLVGLPIAAATNRYAR